MTRKKNVGKTSPQLRGEIEDLRSRLAEAEETLRAIREWEVDAVVVKGPKGEQVYSLVGAESIYRLIVETMKEAAFTVSFDGTILFCNVQLGLFLGIPIEQIMGHSLQEFVTGDNRVEVNSLLIAGQKRPLKKRLVFKCHDGKSLPAHISSSVLNHPDGASIGIVATDLSELERSTEMVRKLQEQQHLLQLFTEKLECAQEELRMQNNELLIIQNDLHNALDASEKKSEALRESEQRFRSVLDNSQDVIYRLNMQTGRFEYVSPSAKKVMGYSAKEYMALNSETSLEMVHPDDLPIMKRMIEKMNKNGFAEAEYRQKTKNCDYRWLSNRVSLIRDTAGRPLYRDGSIRDITGKKIAEDDLHESEERFRTIAETVPVLVCITRSSDATVMFTNEANNKAFGLRGQDIIGSKGPDYYCNPADREELLSLFKKQGFVNGYRLKVKKSDGTPFWIQTSAQPIIYKGCPAMIGASIDITQYKNDEEALKRHTVDLQAAMKELELFSYSLSHDLRTPLRALSALGTILRDEYCQVLDQEGKEIIGRILSNTNKMDKLIEDILNLARISRYEMAVQDIDLSAIACSVLDELRVSEPARKIETIVSESLKVRADERLMRIALSNLIGNAWKYTGKKCDARIEFGIVAEQGERIYFVRNNGAGFDMSFSKKLFTPFHRLHRDMDFPGTGIGLAIVDRIVRRHGGRVWGTGEPDKGAAFYFTLGS